MSKVDEELSRRFHRAERPVGSGELFEELARRRRRRQTVQRVQAGTLAVAVLAATAVGFVALQGAFGGSGRNIGPQTPLAANGEIVFSRKGDDGRFHLFAAQPDGSRVRQITADGTNDTDPAVSPDGKRIAYVHELDQGIRVIATVPIDGGTVTWLTAGDIGEVTDPAWSPDGSTIAFSLTAEGNHALMLVDAASGDLTTLLGDQTEELAGPDWSPDGRWLVFRQGRQLWTMSATGSDPRSLGWASAPEGTIVGAWSPDGAVIAVSFSGGAGGHEIWTTTPDMESAGLVTGGPPNEHIATAIEASLEPDVAWAPDGSALLVSDGEWIYRVDATPDGEPAGNFVQLVRGVSPSWQPIPTGAELTSSPSFEPSASPSPEPEGKDVGLGFNLCHTQRLGGIDWYGDGTSGAAWTGARAREDGRCPRDGEGEYVVAADVDGDGVAEPGGIGFIESCLFCRPFATTDLNADGVLELVVLEEGSSTPSYSIHEVSIPTSERSPGIYNLFVAPPGAPNANVPAEEPLRLIVGGDEGYSGAVACEGYPDAPVLIYTWVEGEVDADTDLEVHTTRLQLGQDGAFHVLASEDSTAPRDAPPELPTEPACGVDWHPSA